MLPYLRLRSDARSEVENFKAPVTWLRAKRTEPPIRTFQCSIKTEGMTSRVQTVLSSDPCSRVLASSSMSAATRDFGFDLALENDFLADLIWPPVKSRSTDRNIVKSADAVIRAPPSSGAT